MKIDILAFGAHPDDVELGAGGTLCKAVALGQKVVIIDLTQGELGTRGSVPQRAVEAEKAAKIIGALAHVKTFPWPMAFLKTLRRINSRLFVRFDNTNPKWFFNAIRDRHIDHGRGSSLVSQACFLSGLIKIETLDSDEKPQQAWRPKQVLHYIQWEEIEPQLCLDISDYLDQKMEAVKAYDSQFFNPSITAPETPISSENFSK